MQSSTRCDNKRACHNPRVIYDQQEAMVAVCTECWAQKVFRKDPDGRMDNSAYLQFFKRDHLQPWTALYFKYHKSKMSVV